MLLGEKVAQLKRDSIVAGRLAAFWQKQIAIYGESKATAFYKHLGLNHLETKSIEWEGLTLSRQPTEVEKLCIKSISQAQDAGKESLAKILLQARTALIDDALTAIKKLKPANFHKLILTMPEKYHGELRGELGDVFDVGRSLVAAELAKQSGKGTTWCEHKGYEVPFECGICKAAARLKQSEQQNDDEELDDLADLTDAQVTNELQARVTSAAAKFAFMGLAGKALWDAVSKEVGGGSTSWIDKIAAGTSNKVLNFGRTREAEDRKDEWGTVAYSALLDNNVCDPCAAADGEESTNEEELTPAPNPDCAGGLWCRCFHVYVLEGTH